MVVKKGGYHSQSNQFSGGYAGAVSRYPNATVPPKPSYKSAYSALTSTKTTYLELNKGDMVQHTAFGRGMVLSVVKMGGDALLEIAFDQIGTKKLMAKTAFAHMKKL